MAGNTIESDVRMKIIESDVVVSEAQSTKSLLASQRSESLLRSLELQESQSNKLIAAAAVRGESSSFSTRTLSGYLGSGIYAPRIATEDVVIEKFKERSVVDRLPDGRLYELDTLVTQEVESIDAIKATQGSLVTAISEKMGNSEATWLVSDLLEGVRQEFAGIAGELTGQVRQLRFDTEILREDHSKIALSIKEKVELGGGEQVTYFKEGVRQEVAGIVEELRGQLKQCSAQGRQNHEDIALLREEIRTYRATESEMAKRFMADETAMQALEARMTQRLNEKCELCVKQFDKMIADLQYEIKILSSNQGIERLENRIIEQERRLEKFVLERIAEYERTSVTIRQKLEADFYARLSVIQKEVSERVEVNVNENVHIEAMQVLEARMNQSLIDVQVSIKEACAVEARMRLAVHAELTDLVKASVRLLEQDVQLQLASDTRIRGRLIEDFGKQLDELRIKVDWRAAEDEKIMASLRQTVQGEVRERVAGDEEVVRIALQAKHMSEKEATERLRVEEALLQRLHELSTGLSQQLIELSEALDADFNGQLKALRSFVEIDSVSRVDKLTSMTAGFRNHVQAQLQQQRFNDAQISQVLREQEKSVEKIVEVDTFVYRG